MKAARLLVVVALAVAGCGSDDSSTTSPSYTYGKDELAAVVVGAYTGTMTRTGKASTTLTLTLAYAPPSAAPACGNRVLCIDSSELAVKGTISTADLAYEDAAVTGTLMAIGTDLGSGQLTLHFPDGVSATVPMSGAKLSGEGNLYDTSGSAGSMTLVRSP